jgi:endogenous inhibitor of DNA gyrase (YacG/DUF329 family)
MIDLGKWASGTYVIPSPVTGADEQLETDDSDHHDPQRYGKSGN